MKKILSQQYDLLESKTFRYIFVFSGMIFAFAFLWIFEPYGLYNLSSVIEKFKLIGLYIGCGLILMVLQFFILQDFVLKHYTVLSTILWLLLSIIVIGSSAAIINDILFNNSVFTFKRIVYYQGVVLSVNIIPVSLFVLIHYNWTLKNRLRRASQVNSRLKSGSADYYGLRKVIINSDNKNESIEIPLKSLLFIATLDNYIELYTFDDAELSKKTIRYSLMKVEHDNKDVADLFRCHKSYMVNKSNIESISGNAAGYKLKLVNYHEFIPVSRKWNKYIQTVVLSK